MQTETMQVAARAGTGKGVARKLRAQGMIPAVIYSKGSEALHIQLTESELEAIFRRTLNRNTLISMTVDGTEHVCLVKSAQRHPVSRRILHVDFYRVDAAEAVEVEVDIASSGTAEGVRMGGRLQTIRRSLTVRCLPANIPAKIEVDVTDLNIGKFIRVSEVAQPEGVEVVYKNDFNLFSVIGKKGGAQKA